MSKKIKYLFFISAFMFLLSVSVVLAEESSRANLSSADKNPVTNQITVNVLSLIDLKQETSDVKNIIGQIRENKIVATKAEMEKVNVKIEALRATAKQKIEDLKSKIKTEKDQVKAEIKKERITKREQALERFDEAIVRIENLKNKVEAQVIKMETRGINISDSTKNYTVMVETKLIDAKEKIAEINALLSDSVDELSKENKTQMTTLTQEVQTLVKESYQALNDEIASLKETLKTETQTTNKTPAETLPSSDSDTTSSTTINVN